MPEGKTIRQIANEIGVSKQAVQKRIAKEPLHTSVQRYIETVSGTQYISTKGIKLIKSAFYKPDQQTISDNQPTPTDMVLSMLKEQIGEKDKQIATLHRLLEQQNGLVLANKKIILQLTGEQADNPAPASSEDEPPPVVEEQVPRFFDRLKYLFGM